MRTELRHGGLNIVRATFTGFQALPSPNTARNRSWKEVMEFTGSEPNRREDEKRYRELSKKHHPDQAGGPHEKMAELNRAREHDIKEIGRASGRERVGQYGKI